MTKTVKKHDQPCFNLKKEKDLPSKTQVLPPQNKKKRHKLLKHDQPYFKLKNW